MVLDEAFKLSARDEVLQRPDIRKTGIHPNFLYPVARSDNVKTGKPHGVSFAGEPIVLVRTERGTVYALEDRCAHRQIPLHLGVVEKDCIKCAYHGWRFDSTVSCGLVNACCPVDALSPTMEVSRARCWPFPSECHAGCRICVDDRFRGRGNCNA